MDKLSKSSHGHLFIVQLWLEELGDGQTEWRGKVQNVENGEAHYFRQWSAVGRLMQAMLAQVGAEMKRRAVK